MSEPYGFTSAGRDFLAGLLLMVLGAGALEEGSRYGFGSLERMGPGLYPALLGGVLVLLGILIIVTRHSQAADADQSAEGGSSPDWRGWFCIIGGIGLFILLGNYAGLAPATFASVLVSAFGDRQSTLLSASILALCCTAVATVVFAMLLHFQMPLLRW